MKPIKFLAIATVIMAFTITARAQGTAFTYQGRLSSGTNAVTGLFDFQFALSNAPSGGSQIGSTITRLGVGVTNGLFTTSLDFGAVFNGESAWLGIGVRTNGVGSYTSLSPLQPVTPTPYATYAGAASAGGLSGTISSANLPHGLGGNANTASGVGATVGGGDTNVANGGEATVSGGGLNIASGGDATVGGGLLNTASGNLATVPGGAGNTASGNFSFAAGHDAQATNDGSFVWADSQAVNFYSTNNDSFNVRAQGGGRFVTGGTGLTLDGPVSTGNQAFEFHLNGQRGLRLEYANIPDGQFNDASINVIGGYSSNYVASGVTGATIAGGGELFIQSMPFPMTNSIPNQVLANFGTVGGGEDNTASGVDGTVAGGDGNIASGSESTVAGGGVNTAGNQNATVGGGEGNTASGDTATIGGGYGNTANGLWATIPGGDRNSTTSQNTFAAGHRAQANHQGAFVWADSVDADFASTNTNSFNVRANGGARFVTSGAGLSVDGPVSSTSFSGNGAGLTNFNAAQLTSVGNGNSGSAGNFFVGPSGNPTATGSDNTGLGVTALQLNSSGSYNTAIGLDTLENNTTGSYNTAIGLDALHFNGTGTNNTALGFRAGFNLSSGSNNIYIGNYGLSTENNTIRIGTPGVQSTTILSGNVAIGTPSPGAALDANITSAAGSGTLIAQLGSPAGSRIQFFDDSPVFGLGPKINFNDSNPGVIQGNANIALLPTGSVGVGTTTPNSDSSLQVKGMVRMGSETGTSQTPSKSILVRRVNSTSSATGQVIARSTTGGNTMTLERDGTPGGLLLKITGTSGGVPQYAGSGITASNLTVNVYALFGGGGNNSTNQIFTDGQRVGYCRFTFGDAFNNGDMTTVEMMRGVDNIGDSSSTWIGTVTSTLNQ